MNFQIVGLDERQFEHLFGASQEVLDKHGIERMTVETRPGYPCRISLEDAAIGETVLLLNYEHLPVRHLTGPPMQYSSGREQPGRLFRQTRFRR